MLQKLCIHPFFVLRSYIRFFVFVKGLDNNNKKLVMCKKKAIPNTGIAFLIFVSIFYLTYNIFLVSEKSFVFNE